MLLLCTVSVACFKTVCKCSCLFSPPATDFALKTSDCPDTEYPVRIMNNDRGCLWYKKDNKFKIPKGVVVFLYTQYIMSPMSNSKIDRVGSTEPLCSITQLTLFSLFLQGTCGSTSYHLWFRSLQKSKLKIMWKRTVIRADLVNAVAMETPSSH